MPKKQSTPDTSRAEPLIDPSMSFETALGELQKIVSRMENKQQNLDVSIADYEKGTVLAALCQKQLDEAQLKVEQLVKTKDGHKFEPLEPAGE